jgi:hypothetical protein
VPGRTLALKKWRARTLLVAAAFLGMAMQPACIFFVGDPGPLQSKRCGFKGDVGPSATSCGSCIASSCQSAVDACCASSSCQGDLNYLDSCAGSGDSTACYTLMTQDVVFNDPSGAFATLGSCVQQNCASKCTGSSDAGLALDTNGPATGVTCSGSSQSCFCSEPSQGPAGPSCTASQFNNGVCCAQTGYPSNFATCTCAPYACGNDGVGDCYCSANPEDIVDMSPTLSCDDGGGGVCCINNEGLCACSASTPSCTGTSSKVSVCSPSAGAGPCGVIQTQFATCSSP